jgi:hypothetical protein
MKERFKQREREKWSKEIQKITFERKMQNKTHWTKGRKGNRKREAESLGNNIQSDIEIGRETERKGKENLTSCSRDDLIPQLVLLVPSHLGQMLQTVFPSSLTLRQNKLECLPGNVKGGSITVLLASCLTGLESAV